MNKELILMGRHVGEVDFDKSCYITKRTNEHMFRKFEYGFGISNKVLDFLIERKIEYIIVIHNNFRIYYTTVDFMLVKGIDYDNEGDKQLILPIHLWKNKVPSEKPSYQTTIEYEHDEV